MAAVLGEDGGGEGFGIGGFWSGVEVSQSSTMATLEEWALSCILG
jgi:hypothetical protein